VHVETSNISITRKSLGDPLSKETYVHRLFRCLRRNSEQCSTGREDGHSTVLFRRKCICLELTSKIIQNRMFHFYISFGMRDPILMLGYQA
jgi:hypothetical protein